MLIFVLWLSQQHNCDLYLSKNNWVARTFSCGLSNTRNTSPCRQQMPHSTGRTMWSQYSVFSNCVWFCLKAGYCIITTTITITSTTAATPTTTTTTTPLLPVTLRLVLCGIGYEPHQQALHIRVSTQVTFGKLTHQDHAEVSLHN